MFNEAVVVWLTTGGRAVLAAVGTLSAGSYIPPSLPEQTFASSRRDLQDDFEKR